jgi:carbonic anhydrase
MKKTACSLLTLWCLAALAALAWASGAGPGISADEALKMLQEGNARYLEGKARHPRQDAVRRALTHGQGEHPFAAVLACADSRAPVEIIFDQGIGDLFTVRVAGNVAAGEALGSLEYAVDQLRTPLVVVLGHSQCGAVAAVLEKAKLPANLAALVEPIKPAAAKALEDHPGAAKEVVIEAAVKGNVFQAMEDTLQQSQLIKGAVKAGKTRLVGALYELDTGKVQWLGPLPGQEKLLGGKEAPKKGKKGKKPVE